MDYIEEEINSDLSALEINELIVTVRAFADIMTNHPKFPLAEWPQDVPTPDSLKELCAALVAAVDALNAGEHGKKAEVAAIKLKLCQLVTFIAQHAVMRAVRLGEPGILRTIGLPMKNKKITKNRPKAKAGVLTVKHGADSGCLVATTGKVPSVSGYELQCSQVDPPTEESYVTAGHFKNCGRMEVKGLESAKRTTLRVRTYDGDKLGSWSPAVSIIVL